MILGSVARTGSPPSNSSNTRVTYKEARKILKNLGFKVPWNRRTAWTLCHLPRDVYIQTVKLLEKIKERKENNLRINRPLPLMLCSAKSLITLGADNIEKIMNSQTSMEQIYQRAFDLDKPIVDLSIIPYIFHNYTAKD